MVSFGSALRGKLGDIHKNIGCGFLRFDDTNNNVGALCTRLAVEAAAVQGVSVVKMRPNRILECLLFFFQGHWNKNRKHAHESSQLRHRSYLVLRLRLGHLPLHLGIRSLHDHIRCFTGK